MMTNYTLALLLLLVIIIVQRYFCPCCPQVSEETDFIVQSAYGVGTHYRNRLPTSETEILLKKVGRHFPIANCIWMNLMFCCLVRFFFGFKINTIASTGFKGDQFDTKIYLEKFHVFSLVRFRFEVI